MKKYKKPNILIVDIEDTIIATSDKDKTFNLLNEEADENYGGDAKAFKRFDLDE